MDKFFELVLEFAKDNGVGVTVPLAVWLVVKVMVEDYREKKDVGEKNHTDIHDLQLQVATMKAEIEAMKKAVY